jgi:hypothetical protein
MRGATAATMQVAATAPAPPHVQPAAGQEVEEVASAP